MKNITQRIANLSPAKRALLEQQLQKKKALQAKQENIISPRKNGGDAPLSFSQQQIWLLDQFEPGNSVYNRPTFIRLAGTLNLPALEKSLNEIIGRHEILRTSFDEINGKPLQKINPNITLKLPIVELSHVKDENKEIEAQRLATQEAQHRFDLTQAPLIKAKLVRLYEQEHILLLTMHHIIFDGWSVSILFKELAVLYQAFLTDKPSPLLELPIQYADFAVWQKQQQQTEKLESQLSYWKTQLGGKLPLLELPTDRRRPALYSFRGAKHSLLLPKNLLESLKALSFKENVTLFMTLLAAFQILLYRYTSEEDIIVGTPIAGRNRTETENLIGTFVNILVLRTQLDGNLTFTKLLVRVRELALGAYAHQDVPLEKLIQELQPERNLSYHPLFQVAFNLRNFPEKTIEVQDLKFDTYDFKRGIAFYDLSLIIEEKVEGLLCVFEYNTDLFDALTIERMAVHFQTLLEGIVNNPQQPISQLPLVNKSQQVSSVPTGQESFLIPRAKNNQVKIRGFRIELGEIESVLNTHPQVNQAVVIVREDISGNKSLVAYVVTSYESLTTKQLREFLKSKLPEYMVPDAFVTLDSLPLTPDGKVNRKALPAPDSSNIQLENNFVLPSNPTEEILATIWENVLGVEKVGIHNNFFKLGGYSLLAIQVISRINQAFSVKITLRTMFEKPTIADLSDRIQTLVRLKESQSENIT